MPLAQEDEIVYLYDPSGVSMAVQNGVAIPAGTSGLLLMGTDGTNARRLGVNASGQAAIQNPSNLDVALSTRATETTLAAINAKLNSLGQKTMANSAPVVIASDQSAIPISGSITATNPSVGTNNTAAPGSSTQVGGSDGTNLQAARVFDADTGAGTQYVLGAILRKAANGGSVEAGTSTDPLRVDPTGTTAQPVTDNGGSLTVDTPQLPAALVTGRLDINTGAWLGSTAPTVGQKAMAASLPVAIASDQSTVPVSLASSPQIATFVAVSLATATANLKSMLSLVNTTGSTVVVRVREIWLVNAQATAVTGVVCQFNLRRCTNHSVGTAITPQPYDSADALNASVTARTGATITGESAASLWSQRWSTDEWGPGALDVESYDHGVQAAQPFWAQRYPNDTKPIVLRANEGVTLKCETNTTTGLFDVFVVFTQE